MKKLFLVLVFVFGFAVFCDAKVYVIIDKATNKVCGTADIDDAYLSDWQERYIIKEAGEEFRGKQPYEIEYKDDTLSFASDEKKSEYKLKIEKEKVESLKRDALNILGLTEEDLSRIKGML